MTAFYIALCALSWPYLDSIYLLLSFGYSSSSSFSSSSSSSQQASKQNHSGINDGILFTHFNSSFIFFFSLRSFHFFSISRISSI
jgi:hypothetical protein